MVDKKMSSLSKKNLYQESGSDRQEVSVLKFSTMIKQEAERIRLGELIKSMYKDIALRKMQMTKI